MNATLVIVMVACTEAASAGTREPRSDLTPEARPFNSRGVALIEAGAYAEGVAELERAYALLPDPLVHRAGRSKVLGSIRSGLVRLHEATGDPAHLERLRDHLLLYLEGLLLALGEQATADDTAGALAVLREVSGELAEQRRRAPPGPVVIPDRPVRASPRVATAPQKVEGARPAGPPASMMGRRLQLAGAVLIGVGVAGLGGMTGTAVALADSRGKLRALTGSLAEPGPTASPMVWEEGRELHERAGVYRTAAVVSGVFGAAALASGVALVIFGKRQAHRLARRRVAPLLAGGAVGVVLGGEF